MSLKTGSVDGCRKTKTTRPVQNLLLPMNPSDYPFCVWEQRPGGLFLRFFPDEDLAAQFCVQNGGTVVSNPNTF